MPKTVLIADDAESQRSLIEILLSSQYLELVSLKNGKEVLEYLKTNTPDLALLDADMPYLGGFDICGKMKRIRRLSEVPVVVMLPPHYQSDSEREKSDELATLVHVDLVIAKPLSDKDLRGKIADLLKAQQQSHATPVPAPAPVDDAQLSSTLLIENALAGMQTLHHEENQSVSEAFPQATPEQKISLLESENTMLRRQVDELDREVRALRERLGDIWE